MITAIQQVMRYETAGDPMTGLKWTHRTTEKIAQELAMVGIQVSRNTVGRLLKTMGFSLRVNHKSLASVSCEDRDAQFLPRHETVAEALVKRLRAWRWAARTSRRGP